MNLKCITISGANEHTDIKELIALIWCYFTKGIKIELGIQVSPTKAFYGSDRYQWLMELNQRASSDYHCRIPVALHVNPGWVEQICAGFIPLEIIKFMELSCLHGGVAVNRIQLNFLIGREEAPDMDKLRRVIGHYHKFRFIIPYNESNKQFIDGFYFRYFGKGDCYFDLLYDESHGEGLAAKQWRPQVYSDVVQGYSGGLSPENISSELTKIALLNPGNTPVWVDAEGNLKGDDGHLSLEKAEAFIQGAKGYLGH